jgi:hypothetical protein
VRSATRPENFLSDIENRLAELLREEEIKWYQRKNRLICFRVMPTQDIFI